MTDLRFPVGRFDPASAVTADMREPAIAVITDLPTRVREAVSGLTEAKLDTPYRPGGWTVRQVVHHVADSHAHAYIRMKFALTEDVPTIKPYDQETWAALPDSQLPVASSIAFLDGMHARWAALWRSLSPTQFGRRFNHPEIGLVSLDTQLQMYAWHSRHHVAHITSLRQREGWG